METQLKASLTADSNNRPRDKWLAGLMSMVMPGLGQVYYGNIKKAVTLFLLYTVLPFIGLYIVINLPDSLLIPGLTAVLLIGFTVGIISIIDAYRNASKLTHYTLQPFNRFYIYIAILFAAGLINSSMANYIKANVIEAFKIPSASMEPQILVGDMLLVDKTAYNNAIPEKGDSIVFRYPLDRDVIFLKKVAGLPGDTVTLKEGEGVVPEGHVYVLGNNIEKSQDSRHWGFVPLEDVLGKARIIYFSAGDEGIRWDRIGKVIDRE